MAALAVFILLASFALSVVPAASGQTCSAAGGFNAPGNVLITDQFNNRIIEVNPVTKEIVWSYGSGDPNDCSPTPGHILGSNWAERLAGGLTVMAGAGTPGCPDNRVIVVNEAGQIVFQYGQLNVTGNSSGLLNGPYTAFVIGDYTGQTIPPGLAA